MVDTDPHHVPPYLPSTVSDEARAILGMEPQGGIPWPPLDDRDAVVATLAAVNAAVAGTAGPLVASLFGGAPTGVGCRTTRVDIGEAGVFDSVPDGTAEDSELLYIAIHGSWIFGAGELTRRGTEMVAGGLGVRTWGVDYRTPPAHPYPAPLDDCLAVYRAALESRAPESIVVGGVSAGGNLAAATILRARDEGLPLPAGVVLHTPAADLTRAGDTHVTSRGFDASYGDGEIENLYSVYLYDGGDRTDPYVSPLFGDFGRGFPPVLLSSGTRDFLLSDTVRLHRRLRDAGVPAELNVWEAAPHYLFMGTAPEDHERVAVTRQWVAQRFAGAARA